MRPQNNPILLLKKKEQKVIVKDFKKCFFSISMEISVDDDGRIKGQPFLVLLLLLSLLLLLLSLLVPSFARAMLAGAGPPFFEMESK